MAEPDAGVPPSFSLPSCDGLAHTCGPAGVNDDCCNTLPVPGGTYFRSYDRAGDTDSGTPNFQATISTFQLDKYEVTVGRFRQFVAAGQGTAANPPTIGPMGTAAGSHPNIPGSGWFTEWDAYLAADTSALITAIKSCDTTPDYTWTDAPGPNESDPMNCITWYEAMAFCAWDNGFLPTEAEWNYAADGGDQQRAFPWGSNPIVIDITYANYQCMLSPNTCSLADIIPVGSLEKGDNRFGQSDLAGSVAEWVLDANTFTYPTPCQDCASLSMADTYRSLRGGGWIDSPHFLRTGVRGSFAPRARSRDIGVRCARSM